MVGDVDDPPRRAGRRARRRARRGPGHAAADPFAAEVVAVPPGASSGGWPTASPPALGACPAGPTACAPTSSSRSPGAWSAMRWPRPPASTARATRGGPSGWSWPLLEVVDANLERAVARDGRRPPRRRGPATRPTTTTPTAAFARGPPPRRPLRPLRRPPPGDGPRLGRGEDDDGDGRRPAGRCRLAGRAVAPPAGRLGVAEPGRAARRRVRRLLADDPDLGRPARPPVAVRPHPPAGQLPRRAAGPGRAPRRAPARAPPVAGPVGPHRRDLRTPSARRRRPPRGEDPTAVRHPLLGPGAATAARCSWCSRPPAEADVAPPARHTAPASPTAAAALQDGDPPTTAPVAARPLPALPSGDRVGAGPRLPRPGPPGRGVRDAITHLLADDPTLEPRDVVVLCPDIDEFAPLLRAAFGSGDDPTTPHRCRGRRSLPVPPRRPLAAPDQPGARRRRRAARPRRRPPHRLPGAGLRRPRRRCATGSASTTTTSSASPSWVEATGIRWGLDAAHRAPYDLAAVDAGTWDAGLDRLLLGVAMSEDDQRARRRRAAPRRRRLRRHRPRRPVRRARRPPRHGRRDCCGARPVADWVARSTTPPTCSSPPPPTSLAARPARPAARATCRTRRRPGRRATVRSRWPRSATCWPTACAASPPGPPSAPATSPCARSCPMRSVPHRVVCLVGLDDGVFPRGGAPDGDDLLAAGPPRRRPRPPRPRTASSCSTPCSPPATRWSSPTPAATRAPTRSCRRRCRSTSCSTSSTPPLHRRRSARREVVPHHPLQPSDPTLLRRRRAPVGLRPRAAGRRPRALAGTSAAPATVPARAARATGRRRRSPSTTSCASSSTRSGVPAPAPRRLSLRRTTTGRPTPGGRARRPRSSGASVTGSCGAAGRRRPRRRCAAEVARAPPARRAGPPVAQGRANAAGADPRWPWPGVAGPPTSLEVDVDADLSRRAPTGADPRHGAGRARPHGGRGRRSRRSARRPGSPSGSASSPSAPRDRSRTGARWASASPATAASSSATARWTDRPSTGRRGRPAPRPARRPPPTRPARAPAALLQDRRRLGLGRAPASRSHGRRRPRAGTATATAATPTTPARCASTARASRSTSWSTPVCPTSPPTSGVRSSSGSPGDRRPPGWTCCPRGSPSSRPVRAPARRTP